MLGDTGGVATVRRLGRGDGAAWQLLYASVADEGQWIGAEAPVDDRTEEIVETYAQSEARAAFLAEVDATPVGWITVDLDDERHAEVGMGVLEAHRRKGLGTALVEAAVAWAEEHAAHRVVLDVFPHNAAAIALYLRTGFVETGRRTAAWRRRNGERWDLVRMERPLGDR
jgi:putative acetyltransferase